MPKISTLIKKIKPAASLHWQIIFTVFAFLAMVLLSYGFTSDIVHRFMIRNSENLLEFEQINIEYLLGESETMLDRYSQTVRHMIMQGADKDALQKYMWEISEYVMKSQHRNSAGFGGVFGYFETISGETVYIDSRDRNPPASYMARSRPWYKAAVEAGGVIVATTPYVERSSGQAVFTYSRAIYDDDGRSLGVAGLSVLVDHIGQKVVAAALAQGGYGMIFSQDLTIIAHPNPAFVGLSVRAPEFPPSIFADDLQNGVEVFEREMVNFTGDPSIAFFRRLPNGWHLGLVARKDLYYKSVNNMALVLSFFGAALAAMLIYVLVRLEAARSRSDAESRYKSVFLANMSHEMRTPLNAVIGLSELILEDEDPAGENYLKLEKIYNAGMTLLSTVNDILDISKIEAGKFELIPVEYDIPSLINDAVTQSILHKGEKPIQFSLDINEDLPTHLFGDELRVKQILNNLLSNAFKYTKKGSVELSVKCAREDDTVWLAVSVRDTGQGIRPEKIGDLFLGYTRFDAEANRLVMGTGLGLSITKRVVDLMGGSITVESEYGKGSVFTVRLPQKFVTDAPIGREAVDSLKAFHYSERKRHRDTRLARLNLPYARVLLVDDVVTNLDVAKGLLKPYKMQVDCVLSGLEAIDAIRDGNVRYNAVFMDHMMPGMDGIEATQIIRELGTDYARNVPIIALTANAIVGNEEMFLSKGFQAFISKPIEIARLDAVIRKWVRDKDQERQFFGQEEEGQGKEAGEPEATPAVRHESGGMRGGIDRKSLGHRIAGLDLEKGIERFGGDEDSYFEVLRSYAAHTPALLETAKAVTPHNLADYTIAVHGVKGSSRGVCAYTVGDMAEALEKAARDGDFDYIAAANQAFLGTTWKLVSELNEMLWQICMDNPRPTKDKPNPEVLERLLKACRDYDMDGVDTALAEIECFDYDNDDGLAIWLRSHVEQMDFKQIIKKLSSLDQ